jgi:hypothetical protein
MSAKPFALALLFTGHMVDLPGRQETRFPQEAEPAAWLAIRSRIEQARQRTNGRIVGIASGARGGDLLFHDACRLFGIERRMVLPFPPEAFVDSSVAGVPNGGWEAKFWDNWRSLSEAERIVVHQVKQPDSYAECNHRMVGLADELAGAYEVIALWDGKPGDGPGGTWDHVEALRGMGAKLDIIDPVQLMREARTLPGGAASR